MIEKMTKLDEDILRELKLIRYMLEDIWLTSDIPKKENYSLEALQIRLEEEMKDLGYEL